MEKVHPNRRQFIKTAAAAAGVVAIPAIIPSSAIGKTGIPAPSDRIRLGHIGVGNRGSSLLRSFLELDEAQSVAVCDAFRSRRESRASEINAHYSEQSGRNYKGCIKYDDFRSLLADDSIDAVVVATPDHWHVPIGILAAKAGKDMYVEKPLGVSVTENVRLQEAVQKYGRVFQYGTQQRSGRNFRFACELVRNGYIGQLRSMDVWCPGFYAEDQFHVKGGSTEAIPVPDGFDYDMWLGPAPYSPYTIDRCTEWGSYYHYDNSLGFIAGWGAHPLDIAQWGNESDDTVPVTYEGSGTILSGGLYNVVDSWDFHCRYENGVAMHFMSEQVAKPVVETYRVHNDHGTTFFGDEGWVSVDRVGIYASDPKLLALQLRPNDKHLYESNHHQRNFVECIRSRQETISPVGAAVQSDIISHVCEIAIRLDRKKLIWDNQNESIKGDTEANRLLIRSMRSPWRLI